MAAIASPSADDLYLAAQWLDVYEGAEDAEACRRVAAWLLKQADAAEFRKACREAGVTVSRARQALKRPPIVTPPIATERDRR